MAKLIFLIKIGPGKISAQAAAKVPSSTRTFSVETQSDLRKTWIPLGCRNSFMSVGNIGPEKIYTFFDANLDCLLDRKSCTMRNNDSTRSCIFLRPKFPAGNEASWRLKGKLNFLKFILGPTWALMTSERKSIRAQGHH